LYVVLPTFYPQKSDRDCRATWDSFQSAAGDAIIWEVRRPSCRTS